MSVSFQDAGQLSITDAHLRERVHGIKHPEGVARFKIVRLDGRCARRALRLYESIDQKKCTRLSRVSDPLEAEKGGYRYADTVARLDLPQIRFYCAELLLPFCIPKEEDDIWGAFMNTTCAREGRIVTARSKFRSNRTMSGRWKEPVPDSVNRLLRVTYESATKTQHRKHCRQSNFTRYPHLEGQGHLASAIRTFSCIRGMHHPAP
eukprot:5698370-Pyramimonas_sp.AAC.1